MTNQQTPEATTNATPTTAAPADNTPTLGDFLKLAEPYIPLLGQITAAMKTNQSQSTWASFILLMFVIGTLGALAGLAMWTNHVDTAEKVIIAMVSFLGGTAMFGGGTKK